jgi:general secretion pathway protein D
VRIITVALILLLSIDLYASCQSKYFSFKVNSTKSAPGSILNVLENLSSECKMSLIFEDETTRKLVNKKISYMSVNDFSLTDILDLLLTENNLFYTLSDRNVLKVSQLQTKTFFIDYVSFTNRSSVSNKTIQTGSNDGGDGSTSLTSTSDFKFWDEIKTEMQTILNRDGDSYSSDKTVINQDAGLITVTGTKRQLDRMEKYIDTLMDRLHKQILIDAKIIEVTYSADKTVGIDWSQFEATLNGIADGSKTTGLLNTLKDPTYLAKYNFTIAGLVDFLKTQGDVNIVSNPKILTLNNQPAVINVGEEKNYKYTLGSTTTTTNGVVQSEPQFEVGSTFVGVTLAVVPQITKDDFIILKINPTISEISKQHIDKDGNANMAPDIKIKQLSSVVKVKNNKKILLGGLIQNKSENKVTKIPGLSAIPILGHAFRSNKKVNSKSELIIVMTPKLIRGDENMPTLDELEYSVHN